MANDIRVALETHLSTLPNLPTDISYENVRFIPRDGQHYLRCEYLPTSRKAVCMGIVPQHRFQGVFRVFVYSPENIGTGLHDDYVRSIIDGFNTTTALTSGTTIVRTDYVEPQSVREDPPWIYTPINIGWYTHER